MNTVKTFESIVKKINAQISKKFSEHRRQYIHKLAKEFMLEKTRNKERTIKY